MKSIYQHVCVLTEKQRTHVVFIIFLFFLLSFIEILGLSLIPAVFMKGIAGDDTPLPSVIFGETMLYHVTVIELSMLVVIVYLVKAGVYILSQYKINQFVFDVMHKNQMRLIHSVMNSDFLYMRKTSVADHVNMIQLHINSASTNYLIPILQIISNSIIIIFLFVFLSMISLKILLAAIVFVGLLPLVYFKNIKGRAYELGKTISRANRNVIDLIKSLNLGWRVIKSLGCESYIESKFGTESKMLSHSKLQHSIIHFIPKPLVEFVLVVLIVFSFVYFLNTEEKIESVIGFMSLLGVTVIRLLQLTAGLMADISRVRGAQHLVEKLVEELQRGGIRTPGKERGIYDVGGDSRYSDSEVGLTLEDIYFRYPEAKVEIIRGLSLSEKMGSVIGIVGDSGAGKSTLVNIIMGFFPASHGRITFSGKEMHPASLISNSSYMTQSCHIFNDTLFNNLALGDARISRAYARNVLMELNILKHDPVYSGLNLDTVVGENGVALSEGEAQRISIARTYAHKAKIVVLDEPTSSLDEENERVVMAYIKRHRESRITFIVSHRKKLLDVCSAVYQLRDGKLEDIH